MKGLIAAVAGLGIGGAAYLNTDGPDFDRVVNKSPGQVYAAFSALAREGTIRGPERNDMVDRQVAFRVSKTRGETIRYEILFDDRPVVTADLTFAAAGDDGAQTRMTAELELDEYEIGSAFETDAGMALSLVPEVFVDTQFANFMDDMVRDVEAGRPLPPLDLGRAGVRRARQDSTTAAGRRSQVEEQRRAASEPTGSAEPMSDPSREARRYRNRNGI
jgi:hypothetical protein